MGCGDLSKVTWMCFSSGRMEGGAPSAVPRVEGGRR